MGSELYLYWRTATAGLPEAAAAMRMFQRQQMLAVPGLQARLLQRADESGGSVTLMEIYALPTAAGGIGAPLRQRIVEGGDAASAGWRVGARHVEVFSEIELPEDRSTRSGPD